MTLLRRHDYPDGKFTLAFVGYGPETEQAAIRAHLQLGHGSVRGRHRLRPRGAGGAGRRGGLRRDQAAAAAW